MRNHHQAFTEALAEIERSADEALHALLGLLLEDSPMLHEHVRRVAHLSVSAALLMGIREPEVSTMEWAALLHHASDAGVSRLPGRIGGLELVRTVPAFAASVEMVDALRREERGMAENRSRLRRGVAVVAVCDRFDTLTMLGTHPVAPGEALRILARERFSVSRTEAFGALCFLSGFDAAAIWGSKRLPGAAPPGRFPLEASRPAI
ncbi:MAG: hypothetical protein WD690_08345 [Vicinamibacterales bacterium]